MLGPSLAVWLTTAALAAELPSYPEEVVVAYWTTLDARITAACAWPRGQEGVGVPLGCQDAALEAAIADARQFLKHVRDDGRIHYLIGLAQRHRGRLSEAKRALRDAVDRAPSRAEAWLDLGELLTTEGDHRRAVEAFTEVVRLVPEGPRAWPGHLQLAQAHAHLGQAEPFATHLRQALRYGFSFQMVANQEAWRGFYADPRLHDALDRLLAVYATEDVREGLRGEAE